MIYGLRLSIYSERDSLQKQRKDYFHISFLTFFNVKVYRYIFAIRLRVFFKHVMHILFPKICF
jgi:hypothetical protein